MQHVKIYIPCNFEVNTITCLNWPSGFRGEDFLKSLQTDDVMAIAHKGELQIAV
jgi:hypothetical protein